MELHDRIAALMVQNRRTIDGFSYTIPSPELYPFQWQWDSCFHAIILSHFDIEMAKAELRSVVARPLPSGLLPHIIYWQRVLGSPSWGRELRGDVIDAAWGVEGVSSITQPPIVAKALWQVFEKSADMDFLREMYPALRDHFFHLMHERAFHDDGLLFIVNPDESGEDNSPRFDYAQGLHVRHTADDNLTARIRLMHEHARCEFAAKTCTHLEFSIIDVSFNALYFEGLGCMAQIANTLQLQEDMHLFKEKEKETRAAIRKELCIEGHCYSYDLKNTQPVEIKTWNLFMPLYAGILTAAEAKELIERELLNEHEFWTPFPLPTVSLAEESYDRAEDAFWRGPVWVAPNWFLYKGLLRYGYRDIAAEIKKKTIALIEKSGFREQYDPFTGEGLGAHDFTWGGLVIDME